MEHPSPRSGHTIARWIVWLGVVLAIACGAVGQAIDTQRVIGDLGNPPNRWPHPFEQDIFAPTQAGGVTLDQGDSGYWWYAAGALLLLAITHGLLNRHRPRPQPPD